MTWKDIVRGVSAFGLLCVWFAWAALVFAFGVAGDSFEFFSNWFWLVIGGRLFKAGVSNDFLTAQFIMSWIFVMMFLMVAPLFLWIHVKRRNRKRKGTPAQLFRGEPGSDIVGNA